eukprot:c19480_g1_i2 orf=309-2483(+)
MPTAGMDAWRLTLLISLAAYTFASTNSEGGTLLTIKDKWKATLPSWIANTDPCESWEGVNCNQHGEVITLNLTNKGLKGRVPDEVSKLNFLQSLDLSNTNENSGPWNQVSGDISPIGSLINLRILHLENNYMTGISLSEFGNLVNLVELTLWNNSFNSKIPVEIANLTHLTYLNLYNCSLWGGLPPEFEGLKNMKKLYLGRNLLTGTVPDSWQNMVNLQDLRLQYNFLTKSFPFWTLLVNLQQIYLQFNQFYGAFPNLSNTHLEIIWLECNFFTGSWPAPLPNIMLQSDGNCFSNITIYNDDSNQYCSRQHTCNGFYIDLIGGCPQCPTQQTLIDKTNCICGLVILLLLIACLAFYKLKNHKRTISRFFSVKDLDDYWEIPKGVRRFTFQELANATSNFHKDHEVGSGGFGRVFCGTLDNGSKVAIKRASPSRMQGRSEFRNEVLLLSRLHHRNLVHLEGFYEDGRCQILVYEYMENGNLHTWLFKDALDCTLSWYKRLDIAVGVARGLEYLHFFADPPVIHRDVKPSNILLDDHLEARLSDFGISRVTAEFETHVSTAPAGTAGYIDPQYYMRRRLTTASDVYGFGVVLLELVTGQKAVAPHRLDELNLAEWIKPRLQDQGIQSIIDPRIGDNYPQQVFLEVTRLALSCTAFNSEDRPSMQEVVSILESHLHVFQSSPLHEITRQPNESLNQQAVQGKSSNSTSKSTKVAGHTVFKWPTSHSY